jgi:hypothetical protein
VRSDTVELDAALREVLRAHLVDGLEAQPHYSVRIGGATGARDGAAGRGLHILYRSSLRVVRARHPLRVLDALTSYLSSHLELQRPDPTVLRVRALPVLSGDDVVLTSWFAQHELASLEPRFNQRGFRVADLPFATVDPVTAEVVVSPPLLTIDQEARRAFADRFPPTGPQRVEPVGPGRYHLRGWIFAGGDRGPLSPAAAVASSGSDLLNPPDLGLQGTLDALARLLSEVPAARSPVVAEDLVPVVSHFFS